VNGNRHSELKQIDISNVAHLAPAWMFPIANAKRLEGTPIVAGGVMYVTTANECYALDAKNGRQIWHYSRPLTKGVIGDAASAINRGVAILRDRIFMITDHAHIIALNRINGELVWDTQMADFREHYGATGAPLVVGNLVLSGTSGGDEGAPGFIAAYDVETGKEAWRFQTIEGPRTWAGRASEHGCVDAWFTGTYDSSTDLIYWPTGNPCPDYNGDERKGDNLYANSVVALEPKTGKLRWYYQFTPHDVHDWDAIAPLLSIDAEFKGKPRKLLVQADRNGFFYVLDRVTGEFLLGEPFVKKMDWADGIDEKGRPRVRESATPTPEGTKSCPSVVGATNWYSSAYNPQTKLFYVMALESCGIYTKSDAWWERGKSFYGGGTRRVPGEERFLRALDIQTGKVVWEVPQIGAGGGWGGVLSTAGGLVFFCDESGALAAADAASGKLLWHFYTNQPWHASPMTYAVDGKQFVAVAAGSNFISFALP
jgi:alcohol dehydrogenase (cytochrome c)